MPKPNNTLVQSYPVTIFPDPPKEKQGNVSLDDPVLDQLDDGSNETIGPATPPSVIGEQSLSGDMPDPEADDDVLANAQQVGLHVDEDEETPQELNIAGAVEAAEKQRRGY